MDADLDLELRQLVIANRVLAHEGVIDAYGHVSVRHPRDPGRFFLAWSRSPEFVGIDDILEFTLDGKVVGEDKRPPYRERFIHCAVYAARPDVNAVVHAHAEDVLPFSVTGLPLRPLIHSGSFMGLRVPVWDIADEFGESTNLLVQTMAQGRSLAACLGPDTVALMRGHGFSAAARTLIDVVRVSVYLPRNARVQMAAMRMGEPKYLSPGEIGARSSGFYSASSHGTLRAWITWAKRAGCADLLPEIELTDNDPVEG